ncbi:MAG: GGDEF domain-containing protein [Lacipirellulaceae bacterium]
MSSTVLNWGIFSIWGGGVGLPETVALAAVAVIGYVFGRSQTKPKPTPGATEEVLRATQIARQLETIAGALRRDLASHRVEVERFKRRVNDTTALDSESAWRALRDEAERVLGPTLRLVGQVATAYDQIRQQSQALSNFSGGRTDALTGLNNGRALRELLEIELSGHQASRAEFAVAVLSIDAAIDLPGDSRGDRHERIVRAAEFLRAELRERDLLARYGIDELVVVMPHTRLFGAAVFGRRLRKVLAERAGVTVSVGLAQSGRGDSPQTLLARADSALYSAKAAGPGSQYLHTGATIRSDEAPADYAPDSAANEAQGEAAAVPLKLVGAAD